MTKISMADIRKHFSEDIRQLNPDLFGELGIQTVVGSDRTAPLRELDERLRRSDVREASNKFGAKKTKVGELTFDSKKEANRYLELKAMQERGEISGLILQGKINLMEGFTYQGEKVRGINYTADFIYRRDGFTVVEDVKSEATARTEAFRLRWRLLQWHYKDVPDVKLIMT